MIRTTILVVLIGWSTQLIADERWRLALLPHAGDSKLDVRIRSLQAGCSGDSQREAELEKLGWCYVEKAQQSYDPGYLKLAEFCGIELVRNREARESGRLLLGHALHHQHRFTEAEVVARRLVAQRGLAADRLLLGDVLMEQGQLDGAIKNYQEAMRQRPGPATYSRSAHIRWLRGDLAGAVEMMARACAIPAQTNLSAAWSRARLGTYLLQLGKLEQSEKLALDACRLVNDYPPALLLRAQVLMARQNPMGAVPLLRRASDLTSLPEYQWWLIEALEQLEFAEELPALRDRFRQRAPLDDARNSALYLAGGEDSQGALELAKQELVARQDVMTWDILAWALFRNGDLPGSVKAIRRALSEGTQDARLALHGALILEAAKFANAAESHLKRALALRATLLPSEQRMLDAAQARILAPARR